MDTFSFSIIVPCHNEAGVIGRKLDNCLALSAQCPVDVLVVDDHSTDDTAAIAAERLRSSLSLPPGWTIRFLTNRHMPGKNGALRTAFEAAKGSLYLITDADVMLGADTLERVRACFEADPTLGALCLSPRIASANRLTEAHYASGYEAFNRRLKMLQSRLDSVPILHGQAMFIRASLKIVPHENLPGDDVDFSFQVRLQGSRVRYAPDLPFYEEISPDSARVFEQKIRRAKAVMLSLWHYKRVLFNPRYGFFGLLCVPLDFLFYFLLPPLVLAGIVAWALWVFRQYGAAGFVAIVGLGLCLSLVRPVRRIGLYLRILLISQWRLLLEQRPHIRWQPHRQ